MDKINLDEYYYYDNQEVKRLDKSELLIALTITINKIIDYINKNKK